MIGSHRWTGVGRRGGMAGTQLFKQVILSGLPSGGRHQVRQAKKKKGEVGWGRDYNIKEKNNDPWRSSSMATNSINVFWFARQLPSTTLNAILCCSHFTLPDCVWNRERCEGERASRTIQNLTCGLYAVSTYQFVLICAGWILNLKITSCSWSPTDAILHWDVAGLCRLAEQSAVMIINGIWHSLLFWPLHDSGRWEKKNMKGQRKRLNSGQIVAQTDEENQEWWFT